ncbi:solute carrier family 2, facilitated glucose transporter member 10 [Seriola aureovittata]|uniref:solute carrier family 2, facilitated glucose transporter member 10 n=1 Tax=Seriola aureovittata TaxID=2871759 RepID=UPI0024BDAF12|nr:solute carrier family 2, facilitated glucose transporter member 10 [Seriola aureovittata]
MGCSILLLASLVSTLGGLVFGYELGIISGALLQLKVEFRLSCVQQEALVSSLLIGALLASTVGGCLIDRHGRRIAILLSNILILTGSLVLLISSYPALVVGRVTVGFAMCISSMSCCIFVSEMVSPDHRGFLVTLYEAGITVGILAAYAINYFLSETRGGWRWMFGFAVVPTLVQLVSIWFLPSSTKDSVSHACCQAERYLMSHTETPEEEDSTWETKKVQYNSCSLFQCKDNMRTRTVIGLGLVLFQQFTGQPNVLFYASTIFHSVGFQSDASAVLASVGLGLVKVIATLTSMVFSDRLGRRPLLISGCTVMAVCLMTIGMLSGQSVMNTQRPCDSEFSVNMTDLPHLPAGHRPVVDTPLDESFRLLNTNTQDENVVFDKSGPKPLEPAPESSSIIVNWIILLCMMAVVSAYSIGFGPSSYNFLSETRGGWRWMFGFAVVPTLVQLVSIWFLPSSTKDSVSHACCQAERYLMSPTETPEEEDSTWETKKVQYNGCSLFQCKDNMRTRTVIGLGLVLFQQFTGQPNVLFYASTIFHSVGFQSDASAVLASVGLGLVKVIATLTSMVFSDRLGRRPLLISGCTVMAVCLMTIGMLSGQSVMNTQRPCDSEFSVNMTDLPHLPAGHRPVVDTPLDESFRLLNTNTQDENVVFDKSGPKPLEPAPESSSIIVNWIILLCMMAVVSAYSIGFGPMTWILLSEIFPAAVRGRAFAFTSCFNWAANLLITCTFLNVIDRIGLSKVFFLYGVTAVAAGIFFYFLLPETKGKTLEQIDQELRLNRFHHGEQCCGCISRRQTSPQYQQVHCQVSPSG